jgi:hypothetical protein
MDSSSIILILGVLMAKYGEIKRVNFDDNI